MIQKKKEIFFTFNNSDVIEERNRLIAEKVGKILKYSNGKIQDLCGKINVLSENLVPHLLLEYLYEKLWTATPGISRKDIQNIISSCHSEAFDRVQSNNPEVWNS